MTPSEVNLKRAAPPPFPWWLNLAGLALISFLLSGVMGAVMVAVNVGFTKAYAPALLASWLLGFVISLPTVAVIVPLVIRWQTAVMAKRR